MPEVNRCDTRGCGRRAFLLILFRGAGRCFCRRCWEGR
jgi:hypothetical protein